MGRSTANGGRGCLWGSPSAGCLGLSSCAGHCWKDFSWSPGWTSEARQPASPRGLGFQGQAFNILYVNGHLIPYRERASMSLSMPVLGAPPYPPGESLSIVEWMRGSSSIQTGATTSRMLLPSG